MVVGQEGRIYGTAVFGGNRNASCLSVTGFALGCGVVFELTPSHDWRTWTERVVYAFCQTGGTNCTDGSQPDGGIIRDAAGNLVGTTLLGGANNQNGVVFEVNPHADDQSARTETVQYSTATPPGDGDWTHQTERVLYNFCSQPTCADSGGGGNAVTMLEPGRIYSGTFGGGAYGQGAIFELSR
jgi:hypothetical protein